MSSRDKTAQSRPRYPTRPTIDLSHRSPSSSCPSPNAEKQPAPRIPLGYVLEWNSFTSRRRNIADVRELRAELLREPSSSSSHGVAIAAVEERRLVVVGGACLRGDAGVADALRAAGGVDAGFLEAHVERRGYRGRRRRGRGMVVGGGWWWTWEYPELEVLGRPWKGGHTRMRCFGRVSLWRGANASILILPDRVPGTGRPAPPPPLKHQDAMTNASALRQHYGTLSESSVAATVLPQQQQQHDETIETAIWDSLGDGGNPVEEILAELVHDRWIRLFEKLNPARAPDTLDEDLNKALEVNADTARNLERHGRPLQGVVSLQDWEGLLARAHRRLLLSAAQQRRSSSRAVEEDEDRDREEEKRSLDRISYLGGILLPVTVVSGVLAIEGDYGPEGNNFWVFWVASLVASVVTILVIHIDRVRSLQVWIEVAADSVLEGGGGGGLSGGELRERAEEVVVRRMRKGGVRDDAEDDEQEEVKAYRRRRLGWRGAVKQVSGYYRWRGQPGMEFRVPRDREI